VSLVYPATSSNLFVTNQIPPKELRSLAHDTGNKLIDKAQQSLQAANDYVEKCENAPEGSDEYCDLANARVTATLAQRKFDELWKSYGGYR